jgi:hypothetical protein
MKPNDSKRNRLIETRYAWLTYYPAELGRRKLHLHIFLFWLVFSLLAFANNLTVLNKKYFLTNVLSLKSALAQLPTLFNLTTQMSPVVWSCHLLGSGLDLHDTPFRLKTPHFQSTGSSGKKSCRKEC